MDSLQANPINPILDPTTASVLKEFIQANSVPVASSIPTGVILPSASSSTPPSGWLPCDGRAVSRSTYSALFSVISSIYGAGDGSTTFNVPNMMGKVPVGLNISGTFTVQGATVGEETHTLTGAEIPAHFHGLSVAFGIAGGTFIYPYIAGTSTANTNSSKATDNAGGGGAHNNIQPSLVIGYYIIKT